MVEDITNGGFFNGSPSRVLSYWTLKQDQNQGLGGTLGNLYWLLIYNRDKQLVAPR